MAMLECTNGHSVGDPRAVRCPDCGARVRRPAGPGSGGSTTRLSEPMALVLGGVGCIAMGVRVGMQHD